MGGLASSCLVDLLTNHRRRPERELKDDALGRPGAGFAAVKQPIIRSRPSHLPNTRRTLPDVWRCGYALEELRRWCRHWENLQSLPGDAFQKLTYTRRCGAVDLQSSEFSAAVGHPQ